MRGGEERRLNVSSPVPGAPPRFWKHVHLQSLWSVERETRQFHSSEDEAKVDLSLSPLTLVDKIHELLAERIS